MKLKSIIAILICGVLAMFVSTKIASAEEVTLFIECSYNLGYGSIDGSGPLYVAYTQLNDADGDRFQIKARKNTTDTFENVGDITGYFGFDVNDSADNNSTFASAMSRNSGQCPKYMTAEYKDKTWGSYNYKVLFYHTLDESANCSGTPGDKCKAHFYLNSTIANNKVNTVEDQWTAKTSDSSTGVCSDLSLTFTIKGNQLYGFPVYGKYTSYLQAENWSAPKVVEKIWFSDIASLAFNNSFPALVFDPDTPDFGDTKTYLKLSADGEMDWWSVDICAWENGITLSRVKNCSTTSDISSAIETLNNTIASLYPDVSSVYENSKITFKDYDPSLSSVVIKAQQYKTTTDMTVLDEVTRLAKSIPQYSEEKKNEILKEYESFTDGTHVAMNGKKPCEATITQLNNYKQQFITRSENYAKKLEVINEAMENAKKRAEELGADQAKLDDMQEVIDVIDEQIDSIYKVITNLEITLIADKDFKLEKISNTGCNLLSPELVEFLKTILWYIRIAGVVLAIILSLVDYIKASIGSDEKSMASANKKFVTRILLVAVLFLIPALLEFLLETLNISTTAGSLECLNK